MAQPIACDICSLEEAVQMLTNLTDGSVLAIGPACMPEFYGNSALVTMDAGQHKGPAGKCQACRRMHEQMTTPVAPAGGGETTASWPDNPVDDGEVAPLDVQPGAPETPNDSRPYSYEEHTAP